VNYPNVYPSLVVAADGCHVNDEVDVYKTMIIVGSYVFKVQLLPLLDDQGAAQRLKRAKRSKVPNLPTPRRHRYDLPLCVCSSTRGCMCRSVCLICCSGSLNIDRVVLSTLLMTRKMSRKGVLLYVY
jgi:hypothetical protein